MLCCPARSPFSAEDLDMESYRRFYVGKRLFLSLAFSDDHAFQPERICHISIRVFFDEHLTLPLHDPRSDNVASRRWEDVSPRHLDLLEADDVRQVFYASFVLLKTQLDHFLEIFMEFIQGGSPGMGPRRKVPH